MLRGTPERCSSARPFNLLARNRDRHLPTVAGEQPNSAATARLVLPAAQAKTILDLNARLCELDGRRAQRASAPPSSLSRTRTAFGRPDRAMRTSIVACSNALEPTEIPDPPTFYKNLRISTLVDRVRAFTTANPSLTT